MRICSASFICFVVFLILKLIGSIDWNWGYVLLPIAVWFGGVIREYEIENHLGKDLSRV